MKYRIVLSFFFLLPHLLSGSPLDSLLMKLNESITDREFYFERKNDTLHALKNRLVGASGAKEKYDLSRQLAYLYSYFENKSALHYAGLCLEIAEQLNDRDLIVESKLSQADLFRFSGLFHEAFQILESIDPDRLSIDYERAYHRVYMLACHSYADLQHASRYKDAYIETAIRYADLYLELGEGDPVEYLGVLIYKFYLERNYLKAANTIRLLLKRDDISPYVRAEYLHRLGLACLDLGPNHRAEALEAFLKSALMSNELAITKLLPFLHAGILLIEGDHPQRDLARRYIDLSLEDATLFGNTRKSDIIKTAYHSILGMNPEGDELRDQFYRSASAVVLMFFLLFIVSIIVLTRNYTELKKSRKKLYESYGKLVDSNRIKEAYIKFFLNRNSEHIEEVNRRKNQIMKMLNAGMPNEKIKQEITSVLDTGDDHNSLLADFDKSTLELYPCFVEGINKLLKPGYGYTIDHNARHKLSTELRILVLVRMGVTDNKQIAAFFRITLQSVYNYRSKARSKAVNEETFDDDLSGICM